MISMNRNLFSYVIYDSITIDVVGAKVTLGYFAMVTCLYFSPGRHYTLFIRYLWSLHHIGSLCLVIMLGFQNNQSMIELLDPGCRYPYPFRYQQSSLTD